MRLREGKGPVWGPSGAEAGTGGERVGNPAARGRWGGPLPTLPGPPSSSAPWKREPVEGEPERRERKQTDSEKSLELRALGLFGLAEPPPRPLPAVLQTDSSNPHHTGCVHTHAQTHTYTDTVIQAYRHAHTQTCVCVQTHTHTHIHTHTQGTYSHAQMQGTGGLRTRGCWGRRVSMASSSLTTLLLSPHNTHSSAPRSKYSNTSHALSLSYELLTWINLFKPHSHSTRQAL